MCLLASFVLRGQVCMALLVAKLTLIGASWSERCRSMRAHKLLKFCSMLSIAGAQALLMAIDTNLFNRSTLCRGFEIVLSTLAGVDAPQAPQLVRGACDPQCLGLVTLTPKPSGSHCYGLHAWQLHKYWACWQA